MKRVLFPLACITLAAAPLALAACGSDSSSAGTETAARAASGDPFPDTKTCPEKSPSFDWSASILNRLPVAVSLAAGEYTCNDWSGVSTPGAVLDGKVLEPITTTYQNSFGFSLEPRKNTTREWTMQFAPADGGEPYGRARVYLTQEAIGDPVMTTPDQGTYERRWRFQDHAMAGWFLRLGPIDAPDTPASLLPQDSTTMGIVVHEGHVAIVTGARVTGG